MEVPGNLQNHHGNTLHHNPVTTLMVCPVPCVHRCAGDCPQQCCEAQTNIANGDTSTILCPRPCVHHCGPACPNLCCKVSKYVNASAAVTSPQTQVVATEQSHPFVQAMQSQSDHSIQEVSLPNILHAAASVPYHTGIITTGQNQPHHPAQEVFASSGQQVDISLPYQNQATVDVQTQPYYATQELVSPNTNQAQIASPYHNQAVTMEQNQPSYPSQGVVVSEGTAIIHPNGQVDSNPAVQSAPGAQTQPQSYQVANSASQSCPSNCYSSCTAICPVQCCQSNTDIQNQHYSPNMQQQCNPGCQRSCTESCPKHCCRNNNYVDELQSTQKKGTVNKISKRKQQNSTILKPFAQSKYKKSTKSTTKKKKMQKLKAALDALSPYNHVIRKLAVKKPKLVHDDAKKKFLIPRGHIHRKSTKRRKSHVNIRKPITLRHFVPMSNTQSMFLKGLKERSHVRALRRISSRFRRSCECNTVCKKSSIPGKKRDCVTSCKDCSQPPPSSKSELQDPVETETTEAETVDIVDHDDAISTVRKSYFERSSKNKERANRDKVWLRTEKGSKKMVITDVDDLSENGEVEHKDKIENVHKNDTGIAKEETEEEEIEDAPDERDPDSDIKHNQSDQDDDNDDLPDESSADGAGKVTQTQTKHHDKKNSWHNQNEVKVDEPKIHGKSASGSQIKVNNTDDESNDPVTESSSTEKHGMDETKDKVNAKASHGIEKTKESKMDSDLSVSEQTEQEVVEYVGSNGKIDADNTPRRAHDAKRNETSASSGNRQSSPSPLKSTEAESYAKSSQEENKGGSNGSNSEDKSETSRPPHTSSKSGLPENKTDGKSSPNDEDDDGIPIAKDTKTEDKKLLAPEIKKFNANIKTHKNTADNEIKNLEDKKGSDNVATEYKTHSNSEATEKQKGTGQSTSSLKDNTDNSDSAEFEIGSIYNNKSTKNKTLEQSPSEDDAKIIVDAKSPALPSKYQHNSTGFFAGDHEQVPNDSSEAEPEQSQSNEKEVIHDHANNSAGVDGEHEPTPVSKMHKSEKESEQNKSEEKAGLSETERNKNITTNNDVTDTDKHGKSENSQNPAGVKNNMNVNNSDSDTSDALQEINNFNENSQLEGKIQEPKLVGSGSGFEPVEIYKDTEKNGKVVEVEKDDPSGGIMTMTVDDDGDSYQVDGDGSHSEYNNHNKTAAILKYPQHSALSDDEDEDDVDTDKEVYQAFKNEMPEQTMDLETLGKVLDELDKSMDDIDDKKKHKTQHLSVDDKKKAQESSHNHALSNMESEAKGYHQKSGGHHKETFTHESKAGDNNDDEEDEKDVENDTRILVVRPDSDEFNEESFDSINSDYYGDGGPTDNVLEVIEPHGMTRYMEDSDTKTGDWFGGNFGNFARKNSKDANALKHGEIMSDKSDEKQKVLSEVSPGSDHESDSSSSEGEENNDPVTLEEDNNKNADHEISNVESKDEDEINQLDSNSKGAAVSEYPTENVKHAVYHYVSEVANQDKSHMEEQLKDISKFLRDEAKNSPEGNMGDLPEIKSDVFDQIHSNNEDYISTIAKQINSVENSDSDELLPKFFPNEYKPTSYSFFSNANSEVDDEEDDSLIHGTKLETEHDISLRKVIGAPLNNEFETEEEHRAAIKEGKTKEFEVTPNRKSKTDRKEGDEFQVFADRKTHSKKHNTKNKGVLVSRSHKSSKVKAVSDDDEFDITAPKHSNVSLFEKLSKSESPSHSSDFGVLSTVHSKIKKFGKSSNTQTPGKNDEFEITNFHHPKIQKFVKQRKHPSEEEFIGSFLKKKSHKELTAAKGRTPTTSANIISEDEDSSHHRSEFGTTEVKHKEKHQSQDTKKAELKNKSSDIQANHPVLSAFHKHKKLEESIKLIDEIEHQIDDLAADKVAIAKNTTTSSEDASSERPTSTESLVSEFETPSSASSRTSEFESPASQSYQVSTFKTESENMNKKVLKSKTQSLVDLMPEYKYPPYKYHPARGSEEDLIEEVINSPTHGVEIREKSDILHQMDNKDHDVRLTQAKALLQLQKDEADKDLERVKSISATGLHNIISRNLEKEQDFIDKIKEADSMYDQNNGDDLSSHSSYAQENPSYEEQRRYTTKNPSYGQQHPYDRANLVYGQHVYLPYGSQSSDPVPLEPIPKKSYTLIPIGRIAPPKHQVEDADDDDDDDDDDSERIKDDNIMRRTSQDRRDGDDDDNDSEQDNNEEESDENDSDGDGDNDRRR